MAKKKALGKRYGFISLEYYPQTKMVEAFFTRATGQSHYHNIRPSSQLRLAQVGGKLQQCGWKVQIPPLACIGWSLVNTENAKEWEAKSNG